jgi:hypothetical protein
VSSAIGKSLWSVAPERIEKLVEAGPLRGGNAYTVLSSRGELGQIVNDSPRSWCGVVGDSRLNVNVEDAEPDSELSGESLK